MVSDLISSYIFIFRKGVWVGVSFNSSASGTKMCLSIYTENKVHLLWQNYLETDMHLWTCGLKTHKRSMRYSSAATQGLLVSPILYISCCIYVMQISVFIFIPFEISCILNFKANLDCLACIMLPVQSLIHSKPAIFPTFKFCVSAN